MHVWGCGCGCGYGGVVSVSDLIRVAIASNIPPRKTVWGTAYLRLVTMEFNFWVAEALLITWINRKMTVKWHVYVAIITITLCPPSGSWEQSEAQRPPKTSWKRHKYIVTLDESFNSFLLLRLQ